MSKKPVKRKRVVVPVVVATVIVAAIAWGPRAIELRGRAGCCGNLQRLVGALRAEPSVFGASSAEEAVAMLVERGVIPREGTVCPVGGRAYQFKVQQVNSEDGVDTRAVLAFEWPENHGGDGACVMFADGHAEFVDVERFNTLVPRLSHP